MGVLVAWRMRNQLKTDFLAANGTQSGLSQILCPSPRSPSPRWLTRLAFPLALNFIASGEWLARSTTHIGSCSNNRARAGALTR